MFIELHTTDGCRLLVNPKEIQMVTEDSYGVTEVTLKGRSSIDVSEPYDEIFNLFNLLECNDYFSEEGKE